MSELLRLLILIGGLAAVGVAGYWIVARLTLHLRLLERRAGLPPQGGEPSDEGSMQVLHDRSATLEQRVAELEERVDFAERLLAQQRERERLAPPA